MPFIPLFELLPEVARQETRSVMLVGEGAEPSRTYDFMALFCDAVGCDCRRAYVQVRSDEPGVSQPRATISWGWEPVRFYRDWASFPLDAADLEELRGPALVRMASQSEEAPELLDRFRMLLEDEAYAARIVRHYRMFRDEVEAGRGSSPACAGASRRQRRARAKRRVRRRVKRR